MQEHEAEKMWARKVEWKERLVFLEQDVVIHLHLRNLKHLEIGGQVDSASHVQQNREAC